MMALILSREEIISISKGEKKRRIREGKIKNFPRKSRPVYDLLRRVLDQEYGEECADKQQIKEENGIAY